MSWSNKFKSGKPADKSEVTEPPQATFIIDDFASANSDIIAGWQLSATLSTRTPLKWLLRHQERASKPSEVPPEHAIWTPVTKTFRELGIDIDDLPPSTMVSEIGQVPRVGGEYLPFLIKYRTIVESGMSRSDLIAALTALGKKHQGITARLGGDLAERFVVSELLELKGCGKATATNLYKAGYLDSTEVLSASVADLTSVTGIGRKTAEAILSN